MRQILLSANWLGSHAHQGRLGTTLRRTAVCSSQVTRPTNAIWRSAPSATERNTSNNLTALKQRAVRADAGECFSLGRLWVIRVVSAMSTTSPFYPQLRTYCGIAANRR